MPIQAQFDDFRDLVTHHVRELEAEDPAFQSTPWYFLRYLKRVSTTAAEASHAREVENSIRALIRFYVDSVDEKSPLQLRFEQVLEYHNRAMRYQHPGHDDED